MCYLWQPYNTSDVCDTSSNDVFVRLVSLTRIFICSNGVSYRQRRHCIPKCAQRLFSYFIVHSLLTQAFGLHTQPVDSLSKTLAIESSLGSPCSPPDISWKCEVFGMKNCVDHHNYKSASVVSWDFCMNACCPRPAPDKNKAPGTSFLCASDWECCLCTRTHQKSAL